MKATDTQIVAPEIVLKEDFGHIVGQELLRERCANSVASAANDGEMLSFLFDGGAGGGKTKLGKAYFQSMVKRLGCDGFWLNSPSEARSKGEAFSSFLTLIHDSPRYIIAIDEAHLFSERPTVQTEKIKSFVMKALDKNNQDGGHIRLDDEISVDFNRKRGAIVLMTNFPHKLDKSGAFQSRFNRGNLQPYTVKDLQRILQLMMHDKGLKGAAKELAMIAKCGRGTARPMEKIVDELVVMKRAKGDDSTVTAEEIIRALQLTKQYPAGLSVDEIAILSRCDGPRPLTRIVLSQMLPHLEKVVLNQSVGYLQAVPITKANGDVEERPFIIPATGGGLQTTDHGKKYLETCARLGFNVPDKYNKGETVKETASN